VTVRLRNLLLGLRDLQLGTAPVIVHASLSSFGQVEEGAQTVVQALVSVFSTLLVPTFTYKTMVIPRNGPPDNAILYGSGEDQNRMAEFFSARMPADRLMGIIPETVRTDPRSRRSGHPILSFAGINADPLLATQSLNDPLAPLAGLEQQDGWAVLLGVDQTVNTSIHCAERMAGRRTFIRWALTSRGVRECPGFPGCSAGFQDIAADMERYTRFAPVGPTMIQAVPLKMLFKLVIARVRQDPLALLCQQADCERCAEIRRAAST
jgi:aminoglycoside 3-N-acetyltransferase